jgi:hypothetical protein
VTIGVLLGCVGDEPTDAADAGTSFTSAPGSLVVLDLRFTGLVGISEGLWDGEEHAVFTDPSTGLVACDYAWTLTDFSRAPDHEGQPAPFPPCADPDGVPCDVGATVMLWAGHAVSGGCGELGYDPLVLGTSGPFGYGWSAHWTDGGLDYGPVFVTWSSGATTAAGQWSPWSGAEAAYDGAVLEYALPFGTVTTELR